MGKSVLSQHRGPGSHLTIPGLRLNSPAGSSGRRRDLGFDALGPYSLSPPAGPKWPPTWSLGHVVVNVVDATNL